MYDEKILMHLEMRREYDRLTKTQRTELREMYRKYISNGYADTLIRIEYNHLFQSFFSFGILNKVGRMWNAYIASPIENLFLGLIQ